MWGAVAAQQSQVEAPIGVIWEMGINLSRVGNDTPDTVPLYNNLRPAQGKIPASTSFSNLVDINAVNRNVAFTVSTNGSDSGSWLNSGNIPPNYLYPDPQIYYAAWFLEQRVTSTFVISGLDDSKTYSFRFLSADTTDYTTGMLITQITIGSTAVTVDASNGAPASNDFDDPVYGAFNDLKPVGGSISISVVGVGAEPYYMLMGIRIREYGPVTPPGPSPKSFEAVYKNNPSNTSPFGYYEFLPEGYDESTSNYPVIISLHGSGEIGNGNAGELSRVLAWGIPKMCNNATFNENFIALSIQYDESVYYDASMIRDYIDYVKTTYKVDPDRIYMTGMSAGGMVMLYYLQNYTSNHGIAAVVTVSSPGEIGYTDTALIAASGCPQWWMSNIGDPITPWQNDSVEYISILNVVSAITAVDPNVVERLTGFNNSTHTGTWDGIYDGSLIGTANVNYDPFDESIYDWMMGHT